MFDILKVMSYSGLRQSSKTNTHARQEIMTTLIATNQQKVECPRCLGSGEFRIWRHIADGECFFCHGAKMVTMYKASQDKPSKPPELPKLPKNVKIVEIEGLGQCEITKTSEKAFHLSCEKGAVWFNIEDTTVKSLILSDGFRQNLDTRIEVKKILQKALKR